MAISLKRGEPEPLILNGSAIGRPPSVSGDVVNWNLRIDLLLFTEEIQINKVIYSSSKIALKTARDGRKNIACVCSAWK